MGLFSARNLVLGGLAIAAYAAAKNKRAVSGLLGGAEPAYTPPTPSSAPSSSPASAPTPEPAAPAPVANADVAGPPENTATHVPAPDPIVHDPSGGIDELAEEEAAAAEAANIGGTPEAYPDEEGLPIDEATRPLEEAGEGYSEGQELAEYDLIENAEPAAGDPIEGGRAIEDAIEAQDDLTSGESAESLTIDAPPPTGAPAADVPPPETPADEKSSAVWRIDEQPTVEAEHLDDDPPREA